MVDQFFTEQPFAILIAKIDAALIPYKGSREIPKMNATNTTNQNHSRVIAGGVPYYIDTANHAYAYGLDTTGQRLQIGEYDPIGQQVTLAANWQELLDERLAAYRAACAAPRLRVDPVTPGKTVRIKRNPVSKAKASS